jgi:ribonuclease HI
LWLGEASAGSILRVDDHGSSSANPLVAGSDGSGGQHGTDPRLRRVGWSWVVLKADGKVLGGATGGIEGKAQTVPRAELFAVVHFLEHVIGHVTLYIDNKYVVDGIAKLRGGWRAEPKTEHGDLWGRFAEHVDGRLRQVDTRKIKSHLEKAAAMTAGVPLFAWEADRVADVLADEAAARHQYTDADVAVVGRIDTTTAIVLKRLVAAASHILEAQVAVVRVPRAPLPPLRVRLGEVGKENGHMLYHEDGIGCRSCR